jgi:predicted CoA-binding protein
MVLGASPNPSRYSHRATLYLAEKGYEVFPVGLRGGVIGDTTILTGPPIIEGIHTVTLYLGPQNQPNYYDYILNELSPQRIIFNPGTENEELIKLARENSIDVEVACTLVLLSIGNY